MVSSIFSSLLCLFFLVVFTSLFFPLSSVSLIFFAAFSFPFFSHCHFVLISYHLLLTSMFFSTFSPFFYFSPFLYSFFSFSFSLYLLPFLCSISLSLQLLLFLTPSISLPSSLLSVNSLHLLLFLSPSVSFFDFLNKPQLYLPLLLLPLSLFYSDVTLKAILFTHYSLPSH